jgi:DNA repair protein RadC
MNWTQTKLVDRGAASLTDAELLDLITGVDGVGKAILDRFGDYKGMANQPLSKFLSFKGLGDARIVQIAASFELAKRVVDSVVEFLDKERG